MKLEVVRRLYHKTETIGDLFIDGELFSYTLEDPVRPPGVKINKDTAIPEGTYNVALAPFRGDNTKLYPHLYNVPMFEGVCLHGGNTAADSSGCILVGFNTEMGLDGEEHRVFNSAIKALVDRLAQSTTPLSITVRNGG